MFPTFSTLGCPDLTLEQAQALAAQHRFNVIEVRALAGTVDLPDYLARTYGAPEQLARRISGASVGIVAFDTSFKLIGGTAADREALRRFVPWAEAAGAKWLRVFDGGQSADATELAEAAATMKWWRELRAQHGWRTDLMVETHDSFFTATAVRRFLVVAPGTGILWDTHHTWKRGGEDPVVTWHGIKAHVVHVHVKDSVSRPSAKHLHTYVLPGTGEFPMKPLITVLRAEYAGAVSLEWEKAWHPYLPPLEEALAAAEKNHWW